MIEKAIPDDAHALAELHYQTVFEGFLIHLGISFLRSLYDFLIRQEMVFVYRHNSRIVGFISGSIRPDGMMKKFLILYPFLLFRLAVKSVVSPARFMAIWEIFKVPEKSKTISSKGAEIKLPHTELLTIAVTSDFQKQQIGTQLLLRMEKHLSSLGIKKYKIIALESLNGADLFLMKNGFSKVSQIKIHGESISNVYTKEINICSYL